MRVRPGSGARLPGRTGSRRIPRRTLAATLPLAALCLSGCTPQGPPAVSGVRMIDGRPVLLLASCRQFAPREISVYPTHGSPDPTDFEWTVTRHSGGSPRRIRLLTVPRGWKGLDTSLSRLDPSGAYSVSVFGTGRIADARVLRFTMAQLRSLPPDHVVYGTPEGRTEVLRERTFWSQAGRSCRRAG